MNVDDLSNLVFRLTNAAIEVPPDAHEAAQVEILRDIFPFDAAWWGWSNLSGGHNRLINTGLFGLPYSYDSAVRAVLHLDPFVKSGRNLAVYGRVIDVETAELPAPYRTCLEAFKIRSILNGHCRLQGDTEFNFFMSFYVRNRDQKFSQTDADNFRTVLRHMEQSLSLSLKTELRSLAPSGGEAAFISVGGAIVRATAGFSCKLEAAGLSKNKVSTLLQEISFGKQQLRLRDLSLEASTYKAGLILVRLSTSNRLARLSKQERRVAEVLLEGLTMRQVADHLGVSHNTIRNQVAAIYRKTGVRSRAMLVKHLQDHYL